MSLRLSLALHPVVLFSSLALGCAQDQGFGQFTPDSPPGDPTIEFSLDIALQRAAWGQSLGRCHLQAALRTYVPRDEEMTPYGDSGGGQIGLPDAPLSCAHSVLEDTGPPIEVGSGEDNWAIAGDDIAADQIQLISDQTTIVLETVQTETGAVRYEWSDCDQDTFPFGQVFDLHLPDASDAFISGFTIESAFAVGPDVSVLSPASVEQRVFHDQATDLEMAWVDIHPMPEVRGEAVEVERTLWARNRVVGEQHPFEALACWPEDEGMMLDAQDLAQLSASNSADDPEYVVGLQVDTVVTSPPFEAPWGSPISVRSTVSDGGDMVLLAVPED